MDDSPRIPLFSMATHGFLLFKRADGRSPATIRGYQWCLLLMRQFLHDPPINAIAPDDLRRFFIWLKEGYKPRHVEQLSNHSLDSFWIATRAFFSWAQAEYALPRPDMGIQRPRYTRVEVVPFTEEEVRAMLKACEKTAAAKSDRRAPYQQKRRTALRDTALVLFLLDTGARVSEAARLKIGDVHMETGEVHIANFGSGTKSRDRRLYLSPSSLKAMWRYLSAREQHADDYVFLTMVNKPMNKDSIGDVIAAIGKRASVPDTHPHKFRHTYAIQFIRNGGDAFQLQIFLGHSDLDMTRLYVNKAKVDGVTSARSNSPVGRWRL